MDEITFPVLAANLIFDNEAALLGKQFLMPSVTFTMGDEKIGIIGYLTPDTARLAKTNNVEFIDEIEAVK